MLSGITENTSPHCTLRETAGVPPTSKQLQAPAFRGKTDAADLPEVAVAELAPRAMAGAWPRPRKSKTRRPGAGRALLTFRVRVRLAQNWRTRDGALRRKKSVPGEPRPSRKCIGLGAGAGDQTEVGVTAGVATRVWGGLRPDLVGSGSPKCWAQPHLVRRFVSRVKIPEGPSPRHGRETEAPAGATAAWESVRQTSYPFIAGRFPTHSTPFRTHFSSYFLPFSLPRPRREFIFP